MIGGGGRVLKKNIRNVVLEDTNPSLTWTMGGQAFFKRGRIFLFLWYSLTNLPLYSSYVIHMSVNHWYLSYNFSTCCVDVRMSGPCCKNEMLCCGAEASKRLTKAPKNEPKKKWCTFFFLVFWRRFEINKKFKTVSSNICSTSRVVHVVQFEWW